MADITKTGASLFARGWKWIKDHKKTTALIGGAAVTSTALNSSVAEDIKARAINAAKNEGGDALQDEVAGPLDKLWDLLSSVWDRALDYLTEKFGPMFGFTADTKKDKNEEKEDVALKEEKREAKVTTVAEEIVAEEKIKADEVKFQASNPGPVRKTVHDIYKSLRDTLKFVSAKAKEWYNTALGNPIEGGRDTAKVDHMMDFFKSKGWTTEQAAGIVANLAIESNFDHRAVGDYSKTTKAHLAYGLGQWHPSRQADFKEKFGHDMKQSTMDEQLEFIHFELTAGKEKKAGERLKQAVTAKQSGAIVSKYYERPSDKQGEASKRSEVAALVSAHQDVREQEVRLARNYNGLRTGPDMVPAAASPAPGVSGGSKPDVKKDRRLPGVDPTLTPDGVG
ncbi:MAG: phage tail tip lysozyme [Alphaproteobacteria bacterium]